MRIALTKTEPGLPVAWYYDAAHYERELEACWYAGWVALAREEELPQPGDWRLARLGTQSVLLVRDAEGALRAFHNTCRHRGSVLCTEDAGRFPRHRIVCPYHAWTYDLAGRLVATPRRMETPDFRADEHSLFGIELRTWGGFVFANLDGAAHEFDAWIAPLRERLAPWRLETLRIGKRIISDVRANWKLLAENFSECFHCPPVHPELCRVITAYREGGAWGLRGDESLPEYRPGAQTLTLDGTARLPPFAGLDEAQRAMLYIPEMTLPNLFLNVQPDYVNSHLMFPTGPQSVRIVYDWLFEPRHLPLGEADLAHYVALWDITNRQDARNCEWQQEGMRARPFRQGTYMPQEFDCHRFATWVRERLAQATRPEAPAARGAPSPT